MTGEPEEVDYWATLTVSSAWQSGMAIEVLWVNDAHWRCILHQRGQKSKWYTKAPQQGDTWKQIKEADVPLTVLQRVVPFLMSVSERCTRGAEHLEITA